MWSPKVNSLKNDHGVAASSQVSGSDWDASERTDLWPVRWVVLRMPVSSGLPGDLVLASRAVLGPVRRADPLAFTGWEVDVPESALHSYLHPVRVAYQTHSMSLSGIPPD